MLVNFSHTGEKVLQLGLGTHGLGHAFGGVDEHTAERVFSLLKDAVPNGQKVLIDTAPRYGHGAVEKRVGHFLRSSSSPFLVASKCGRHISPEKDNQKDWSKEFLRNDIENSLKRLSIDGVFLYQLHNPDIETIKKGDVFSHLEEFKREGLISWYGLSINYPEEGIVALDVCDHMGVSGFVSIQAIYSVFNKEGFAKLACRAKASDVAIISREVMMRGFLTGKYLGKSDFSIAPSAIQKLVNIYGVEKLNECAKMFSDIITPYGLSMAQSSIAYSLLNPGISVTLTGINRVEYFNENWSALGLSIPVKVLEKLDGIKDISPRSKRA